MSIMNANNQNDVFGRAITVVVTFILMGLTTLAQDGDMDRWLEKLDSYISREDEFTKAKIARINEIKGEYYKIRTDEELYWYNRRLYDEYFVFDVDSAMRYVNANLALARKLGNETWEQEWKIKMSFGYSVMGLLKDAEDIIAGIDASQLSPSLLSDYYVQKAYLYSHLSQLSDHRNITGVDYDELSRMYDDSISVHMSADCDSYIGHQGAALYGQPDKSRLVMENLRKRIESSRLNDRQDAINAYVLSRLYDDKGDQENRIKYLAISGCVDVSTANRDIASLEELASILKERGDIDRAYRYINYCSRQAMKLPNRVRAASLARVEAEIHTLYVDRLESTGNRLQLTLWGLCGVLMVVVFLIVALISRARKLSRSKVELSQVNVALNNKIKELEDLQLVEKQTLHDLQSANQHINDINQALTEANFVKETCIGATFALCSSYIDRLDKFKRTVSRMVRSNSWNELRQEVSGPSISSEDLKEFYHNFDSLFLSMYPDFVTDFNNLLRPDERITVKDGELNMELRIYALVRLGINDSVKIAGMLHCSPQTVYNYRLRARNKSFLPKDEFIEQVKNLGTYNAR